MRDDHFTRFYVYVHIKPTGEIFYVGKGSRKRAWDHCQRSKHWSNIVNKHGLKVTIVRSNLTEQEAFNQEKRLILYFSSFGSLCNQTTGGPGSSGSHLNLGIAKSKEHKHKLRLANLGKKQAKSSVEKRIKVLRAKIANGWKTGFAVPGNAPKGRKNNNFCGVYITPAGVYDSLESAAKANDCGVKAVKVRCRGNRCAIKGKVYTYPPKDGWSFRPE